MPQSATVLPLAVSLGAYFVLQILLNLRLRSVPGNAAGRRSRLLATAFGNGVINSLFFITTACVLVIGGFVPRPELPAPLWPWLLGSLPIGILLWALRIRLAGIGRRLTGGSSFVLPAEELLRNPANLTQLNRAALYISILEPLGHELFFRACFLSAMFELYGMWPAILATAIMELLLRLNPAWALAVVLGSLLQSGVALAGGGPLATVCVALFAGFLQAYVTAYQSLRTTAKPGSEG